MLKAIVFYDYNCPFCYLGMLSLKELSKEFELDIEWKGFEIHPEFPPQGKKSNKKSSKSIRIGSRVSQMASQDGITIKSPGFAANSRLALEASEFAKTKGLFEAFHEAIYEAYFRDGLNIGDINRVFEIGTQVGLDKDELKEVLNNRAMYQNIDDNKKEAQKNNILGVPTYILGGFPIHGYQSKDTFRKVIERAAQRSK